uniref:transposase n=1 Tax=Demequina lutea TaxID=431489 RepID=UPI000A0012FA
MSASRRRFTQEFRDELCLEVISTSRPVREVAEGYGVGTETLRSWLVKYRQAHGGTETELTAPERPRPESVKSTETVVVSSFGVR